MTESPKLPRQPFQFSLRWLLILITVVALLFGLATIIGDEIFAIAGFITYSVLPAPLLIAIIYARGNLQTFAIGAMAPWVTMTVLIVSGRAFTRELSTAIWFLVLGALSGALAVATRRWIERNGHGI